MLKDRETSEGSPGAPDGCAGCGGRISDRYYLLAADRQWHAHCLRCCECQLPLDSELTCFARDRNIYCKEDYYRMFCVKRCSRCHAGISANELVMRARELVYHVGCFTCTSCGTPLSRGDTFGMRDGLIYCRPHYELIISEGYCEEEIAAMFRANGSPNPYFSVGPVQKGRPRKRKAQTVSPDPLQVQAMRMSSSALDNDSGPELEVEEGWGLHIYGINEDTYEILHPSDLNSSMESLSYDSSVASPGSASGRHSQRTKRMRTSFKHHQLRTMKSYFAINQNPDAKDLKQLAQKTGLSKRVLQVWFQNARAKWRRNIMRQESGSCQGVSTGSGVGGISSSNPVPPPTPTLHHQLQNQQATFADVY